MKETTYAISFKDELGQAYRDALEVAELYTELINHKAQPLQAIGPILMAMHCPDAIEQKTPISKDDLLEAVKAYSEVCADFAVKYKIRNYNFFGAGHYRNYSPKSKD